MNIIEFNNLTIQEKWSFVYKSGKANFVSFREYYNQKVTLWDCGTFFVEVYYMAADNTYTKIEGFEQNDKRLNIYIDYMNKTKDYPFEND